MVHLANQISVYLEIGQKRTFAGAVDWPGWCRAGRDEAAALQAPVSYTHLRAHETVLDLVCRLLLEKKNK
mgnify:CR=1 FL=1